MKKIVFEGQVLYPPKVFCVGRNYALHIDELQNAKPENPVIFIKPNVCIYEGHKITFALDSIRYEGEISFLLQGGQFTAVAFGIDFTAAKEQEYLKKRSLPWEKAKAFKDSAVFSEFACFDDMAKLGLELYLNGEFKQKGGTKEMLFAPREIMEDVVKYFEIEENDIVMCGTPSGVGEVRSGDVIHGRLLEDDKVLIEQQWKIA